MTQKSALLLLVLLHLKPTVNAVTLVDYWFNLEYIKEVLCINKERPKLQCNGKCYLMQQLRENQPEEKEDMPWGIDLTKTEYVDLSRILKGDDSKTLRFSKKQNFHYCLGRYQCPDQGIFRPPRF